MITQQDVTNYWNKEVCGTRFSKEQTPENYYKEIVENRYYCEPYIKDFAFSKDEFNISNKTILEIGVGAGTDFIGFLKRKAICYGIDATDSSINETNKHIKSSLKENEYNLQFLEKINAENLPFDNNKFDLVYSHGVLHHAKKTMQCFSEAIRVLKDPVRKQEFSLRI